ncbi:MAG: class I SAM-dependent methyltransferase [Caulobacterales bacterium]
MPLQVAHPQHLFDARLHRQRKARAANGYAHAAFLHARTAQDLLERLEAIKRPFPRVLTIGAATAFAALHAGAEFAVATDVSHKLLPSGSVALNPEHLPFAPNSFNLILAPLALNWTNDLPGTLIQLRASLLPDGLLLATLFGPETLHELRSVLLQAESELTSGAALRIAPFAELREAAGLLQRAGFALPAADRDVTTVRYRSPFALLQDLRAMGETAAFTNRAPALRRAVILRAMALYQERFGLPDGRVQATFEIVTLTGWNPHESQQKPLRPGSAKTRLSDALGVAEWPAGEKAGKS